MATGPHATTPIVGGAVAWNVVVAGPVIEAHLRHSRWKSGWRPMFPSNMT